MNKNKGFTRMGIILAIISVLVIGSGAYFLSTKNDLTSQNIEKDNVTEDKTIVNFLDGVNKIVGDKLPEWKSYWQNLIPGFNISAFKKIKGSSIVAEEYPYDSSKNKLREAIYVYSPDKTKIIDPKGGTQFYEENGKILESQDVDSSVSLIDLKNKTLKLILSCGTPCGFSGAAWIDDNTFVVVGRSEYYPENGETRCTVDTKCTDVATLNVFDLLNNKNTLYYGPEIDQKITRSYGGEDSSIEIFNNQPGDIKSILVKGNNQWTLAVDLLSRNPDWLPGVDSTGEFFINQNPKIRNLNVTENTKTYNCQNTKADLLVNTATFISNLQKVSYKTVYFDINGENITAMYQQCLP